MYGFADKLRSKGRFGDSLVAHLSEAEARLLKKRGGSGTTNPFTGAVEFYKGAVEGEQANNPKSSFFQSLASIDANEREEGTRLDGFYNNIQALYDKNRADTSPKNGGTNKFQENQALAVAKILNNTRYVYNDKEGIHQYMYFSDDGHNPYQQQSYEELDKRLHEVSPRIRQLVIGGEKGDTNEDMAPRDMSIFLKAISSDGLDRMKRGRPLVSKENLFDAYEKLGITPYDLEGGKRNTQGFQGDGYTTFELVDNKPISLAQQEVTDAAFGLYSKYKNGDKSSADSDGTGGTGSMPNLGAGAFDSFGAFAEAAFAPASYNQGSFNNLANMAGKITREGIAKFFYQEVKKLLNSPTKKEDGTPFRNFIDSKTHAGDAPATNYREQNYDQFGDFGFSGGGSGVPGSFAGRGSTSF